VKENFRRYNLLDDKEICQSLVPRFRGTLHVAPIRQLSVLRMDGDLYESIMGALDALYAKVSSGGFIIVDDFNDLERCRCAVLDFRERHNINDPMESID
jgi:O-methyltransferase